MSAADRRRWIGALGGALEELNSRRVTTEAELVDLSRQLRSAQAVYDEITEQIRNVRASLLDFPEREVLMQGIRVA